MTNQEDIKFWEKFGVRHVVPDTDLGDEGEGYVFPDGLFVEELPASDSLEYLGFLFKYCMPKLKEMGIITIVFLQDLIQSGKYCVSISNRPYIDADNFAIAFKKAIEEVIND
jgi:hypothetical protein